MVDLSEQILDAVKDDAMAWLQAVRMVLLQAERKVSTMEPDSAASSAAAMVTMMVCEWAI